MVIDKNWFNRNWKNIAIVLLVLFSLNKCTVSCTRGSKIDSLNSEISKKDIQIKHNEDTIDTLSRKLDLCYEKIYNYEKTLKIKDDAMDKITEAKKNINVTVKSKK